MAFKDLREFVAGRELSLPIGGKTYVIKEPDAATGMWVQQLLHLGERAIDDDSEDTRLAALLSDDEQENMCQRVLGAVWGEMVADGVTLREAYHAGTTAAIWLIYGEAAAELYWSGQLDGGDDDQGEAGAPDTKGSRPASGAAATTTPTRGSGSTTKGSKKLSKQGRRGRTSSPSGRS